MKEIQGWTIETLISEYRKKTVKPSEVASSLLEAAQNSNSRLNIFLELNHDRVIKEALQLDAKLDQMDRYPLFGVPITVKDNFLVTGYKATAGSQILKNYVAPFTATCVQKLIDAGAIILGKTNCDEFAMGSSNENSSFGPVRNPWDPARVPGGSSGGSAASVAGSFCFGSLGTDTGGSIRQPASLCGVVGLKPTYGRVSRYGIIAYASSLDQAGPLTKTVWDTARVLEAMSGYDPKDATSSQAPVPAFSQLLHQTKPKPFKVGVLEQFPEGVHKEVVVSYEKALEALKTQGIEIVKVKLPYLEYALATYYLIAPSEASSNLARYDGIHYGHQSEETSDIETLYSKSRGEGFGPEVKLRIMVGTFALSSGYYDAYYEKATQVRKKIKDDFLKAFESVDAIVTPTSPTTAFKLGEKTEDPVSMYLSDIFTIPVNLAGLPGLSVPCGKDTLGLPIGLQFIGRPLQEVDLLQLAYLYEKARGQWALPT